MAEMTEDKLRDYLRLRGLNSLSVDTVMTYVERMTREKANGIVEEKTIYGDTYPVTIHFENKEMADDFFNMLSGGSYSTILKDIEKRYKDNG